MPKELDNRLKEFTSVSDNNLKICQNIKVYIDGKRRHPDVSIFYKEELKAVISIKVYLTYSTTTIKNEVEKLKEYLKTYPKLKVLLVIYYKPRETELLELNKQKVANDWFNFLILGGNEELLEKELEQLLSLNQLCS